MIRLCSAALEELGFFSTHVRPLGVFPANNYRSTVAPRAVTTAFTMTIRTRTCFSPFQSS